MFPLCHAECFYPLGRKSVSSDIKLIQETRFLCFDIGLMSTYLMFSSQNPGWKSHNLSFPQNSGLQTGLSLGF